MLERGVWWSGRETRGNLAATYKHLMFWALWDTASFCLDNRLKTPLGSNKDTLGLIDKAIRNFDRQLSIKPRLFFIVPLRHTKGPGVFLERAKN